MDDVKLLPCPFCGCEVQLITGFDYYRVYGEHTQGCVFLDDDPIIADAAEWNKRGIDYDAQRLRADTAEAVVAERDEALALVNRDLVEAQTAVTGWARKHAAAEQRIAELYSASALEAAAKKLADCMDYPWEHMPEKGRASMRDHVRRIVDAALNPKPEAGSHVDCGSCRNINDGCKDKCQRSEEWSKP